MDELKEGVIDIVNSDDDYDSSNDPDYSLENTMVDETTVIDDELDLIDVDDDTEELIDLSKKLSGKETPKLSMAQRIKKYEIPRKLFHSSIGFITLYLYSQGFEVSDVIRPLTIALIVITILDLIRFRIRWFNKLYILVVGILMREREQDDWNGVIFYLAGLLSVFYFYPKDICMVSVLFLSFCDTAASAFGRKFGKYTPKIANGKSVAGSLGAALTGAILYWFFYVKVAHTTVAWKDLVASGIIAAASEGIELGIDDNFTIPFFSALFLSVYRKLIHL